MKEDLAKARRKAQSLVEAAAHYRDNHGYRENLGFDSQRELEDYMSTLDLSYSEATDVLKEFWADCSAL